MLLELICFLCGAGLAVSGSLWFWPVHNWWDFYIPIVLYMAGWIGGIGVIFILEWIAGLFVNKKKPYEKVNKWARFWFMDGVKFILNHAHVWASVHGGDKLPKREKFLMVCNHRSKFDNFVITDKFGKLDIAFVTKKENTAIPVAGSLLPGMCYLSVDRDDKLQSLEAFKRAIHLINDNITSVAVFPEGKRQTEEVIGEFHEGPFNIAIHSKCPIVVSTICGTDKVHKRWPIRATRVRYDIIAVIPYEEYQDMPAKALSDMIHQLMFEHLQRVQKDY